MSYPWRSAEWDLVFRVLPRAHRGLARLWWLLVTVRSALPAVLIVATGALVGAVSASARPGWSLGVVAASSILILVLSPVQDAVSANLGARAGAHLHERLLRAAIEPPGIAHLEEPELADEFGLARDFDLGITAPPLRMCMPFVANGLVEIGSGLAAAAILFWYRWWAPLVLVAAWLATHRLLRESTVWRTWRSEEVMRAQRHADYAYRMAVDVPAAKELRLFGLGGWTVSRFASYRRELLDLSLHALRLRERSLLWAALAAFAGNGLVMGFLAADALAHRVGLGNLVMFTGAVVGAAVLGVADFDWWFDTAARPAAVVASLQQKMPDFAALPSGSQPAAGLPGREIRLRGVSFGYRGGSPVLTGVDLVIPAGSSLAIVGQNGAGKTTLAKLLCRLYDPTGGVIEADGIDLRDLDLAAWRSRLTTVFQDYVRYELSLRENVAPTGAGDADVEWALRQAGAADLAADTTVLSKSYAGGTDLSGGQWQRVALARAMCAVRQGAGLVILDEPTAQLDVRGEAEIFRRLLDATSGVTTILVSHRFSTVRHADNICVLEGGRVVELGTHDKLMARGGRYATMFTLQAARFADGAAADELDDEDADGAVAGAGRGA
ncbi:MAG TPA: ABC transporter ATP-binding protein [Streptosporangiaceae bacterium]|nr:ABC transporter ATP-binding protein [Streptosporangiaceae bacterium]